jgi:hypothetical protein
MITDTSGAAIIRSSDPALPSKPLPLIFFIFPVDPGQGRHENPE